METSPAGITLMTVDGKINFANQKAKEILHLDSHEEKDRTSGTMRHNMFDFEGRPLPEQQLPVTRVLTTQSSVYGAQCAISSADSSSN